MIVGGRWRWIFVVGMVLGALSVGLRDVYRGAIRGGFSFASSSGIMDLFDFILIFVACLAGEMDGRSLEVIEWELEPRDECRDCS